MKEHSISVPKTARYYTLGELSDKTEHVWFVLHGYGNLAQDFIQYFEPLDKEKYFIVAPEGLHRFYVKGYSGRVGATWMTKEDRTTDIADYIGFLNMVYDDIVAKFATPPKTISLLGFSQGAATACRWAGNGHIKADHLILWSGMFPPDLDLKMEAVINQQLKTWLVYGNQDEFFSNEEITKHIEFIKDKEIGVDVIRFDGKHEIPAVELVDFAKKQLQ